MTARTNDSVPLAARGFLLALVACLHVAGAAALSNLSGPLRHDEGPSILRASWIEGSRSAVQPASQPPVTPPTPTPKPRPQPAAIQSALAPAVVDTAVPVEPIAQVDSTPASSTDVSAAVAGGAVVGNRDGESDQDYVGPDFNVSYFSNPEPEYPPQSRRLREQGLVKLRVHVTEQGRAGEVTLHKSSGYMRLDKAAFDAVWRWRFRPAQRAGLPVAGWVVVPIRFELQG